MMPLTMLNTGEPSIIKKVGGKEETRRFLENLGFVVGGRRRSDSRIRDRREYDRQHQGFKSCDRKRYGE